MRYIKDEYSGITDKSLQIEHRGEVLQWDITTYRSMKINDNLITDINSYWSRLPMQVQDEIFSIYKDIQDAFDSIENTRRLNEVLVKLIAKLFEYHKFEDIFNYYRNYSRIKLPLDLKNAYGERDTKELTYLRGEYIELIAFTIALKIMIPIWGRYISLVGNDNPAMKEYRAASLLVQSNIVTSAPYVRLMNYTTTYWEGYTDEHSGAAILAGLNGSQVPTYLLGNVLIRRISSFELLQENAPGEAQTIISAIYNYIDNLTKTMDKQFGGRINEKSLENSAGDDDNTSYAENYKIKQEISEGVIVAHEVHLINHTESIIKRLNPNYDTTNFKQFLDIVNRSFPNGFMPTPLSMALTQWTLDPVITAGMLRYVKYDAVLAAHAAAYVLLRSWGFDTISLFLFTEIQQGALAMNNVVRQQVTDENLELLEKIYPYSQNVTTKRKPSRRDSNVAIVGIRHVITPLYNFYWKVAPWVDPAAYPSIRIENRLLGMQSDMENQLAELIIFLKTKIHPGLTSIVDLKPTNP